MQHVFLRGEYYRNYANDILCFLYEPHWNICIVLKGEHIERFSDWTITGIVRCLASRLVSDTTEKGALNSPIVPPAQM